MTIAITKPKPGERVRVKMLESTMVGGQRVTEGATLEVSHEDYLILIAVQKAQLAAVTPTPAPAGAGKPTEEKAKGKR